MKKSPPSMEAGQGLILFGDLNIPTDSIISKHFTQPVKGQSQIPDQDSDCFCCLNHALNLNQVVLTPPKDLYCAYPYPPHFVLFDSNPQYNNRGLGHSMSHDIQGAMLGI